MALVTTGEMFVWGYNGHGQLGLGHCSNASLPTKITALNDMVIKQVNSLRSLRGI
jgi:RCC1 and BTB domain-containing protein